MDKSEIEQKVKEIVALQFDMRLDDILLIHNFQQNYGTDSLDTVEMIMAVEDRFNVDIEDEEAEKLTTVQIVVDFLVKRLDENYSCK